MSVSPVSSKNISRRADQPPLVQLWSMKNYRYYLKQEIFSHKQGRRRFQGFRWHPEQPLTIYLLGESKQYRSHFSRKEVDFLIRLCSDQKLRMGHVCCSFADAA